MSCLEVLFANKWIVEKNLSILTWGNVSKIDREKDLLLIKPSGADLDSINEHDIATVKVSTGERVSGLKPSVDTDIHLELYRGFEDIGSVVHTHSVHATAFAQAHRAIPCLGTTHADYFHGEIPCVNQPTPAQVENDYERHTGQKIVEYFNYFELNPNHVPAALVAGHGVFCWGKTLEAALETAIIVETVAEMALHTLSLNKGIMLDDYVLEKHFMRKHGDSKYYGQQT
jgi:L-ribulose-5-phosphate 4-epimerase